jgi:hypothetical protein
VKGWASAVSSDDWVLEGGDGGTDPNRCVLWLRGTGASGWCVRLTLRRRGPFGPAVLDRFECERHPFGSDARNGAARDDDTPPPASFVRELVWLTTASAALTWLVRMAAQIDPSWTSVLEPPRAKGRPAVMDSGELALLMKEVAEHGADHVMAAHDLTPGQLRGRRKRAAELGIVSSDTADDRATSRGPGARPILTSKGEAIASGSRPVDEAPAAALDRLRIARALDADGSGGWETPEDFERWFQMERAVRDEAAPARLDDETPDPASIPRAP